MTDVEKLILLRTMISDPAESDEWSDEKLFAFLTIAGQKIIRRAFPYDDTITDVPNRYAVLQCEIAAFLLNKRGAEGETSHSENGISRAYENGDVPSSLLNQVVPFCGVI
jgi:hypothetical protein